MGQANVVTQRLFSLIDTISNAKLSVSHESCEIQRKKLMQDLATSQHQIQILTHQWAEHTCWNGQDKSKLPEDITRYVVSKSMKFQCIFAASLIVHY